MRRNKLDYSMRCNARWLLRSKGCLAFLMLCISITTSCSTYNNVTTKIPDSYLKPRFSIDSDPTAKQQKPSLNDISADNLHQEKEVNSNRNKNSNTEINFVEILPKNLKSDSLADVFTEINKIENQFRDEFIKKLRSQRSSIN